MNRTASKTAKTVTIGGACAFVGDSILGPRQLVAVPGMQYLVFDYLAEMTLSSFAHTRQGDPAAGWASEFVELTLREILPACQQRGIRLVANAGGLNPAGCAQAIGRLQRELGTQLTVACVEGDDCLDLMPSLRAAGAADFYTGESMPAELVSANAYLGALPIARALAMGADIVVTGRIVDSATTLGVLMHEYGWTPDDHDALAMGSLAGHILECGPQATGGIHTDWHTVPDWENIGYPVIECHGAEHFVVSKPAGTGGLVTRGTVSEQILYEVGDPARYRLPDVCCDFTGVTVTEAGPDRVVVRGARGQAPGPHYKLSAAYLDGYRCVAQLPVFGIDAVRKARRTGEALLGRARAMALARGLGDFEKVAVGVVGAEDGYGPRARAFDLREAIARVAATHPRREALELFSREARVPGVSFAPGTTTGSALMFNSRPVVEPRYRLFTCLVDKARLAPPRVTLDGQCVSVPIPAGAPLAEAPAAAPRADAATATATGPGGRRVPLVRLAWGRSGDKGNTSNIAVIARRPAFLPFIEAALSAEAVKAYLAHLVEGAVVRHAVPGLHALNFVLDGALDGGGPSSLRPDPMGKGMAQQLLEFDIPVPDDLDV
ncbi:acyclic terpene utilization AtuA family protein [Hydrogenophaga borbori]|uniref:acyclic terpene utilization AtuA family protein n=1 Tax=Hydrogenophaga borbori TaxID=2294117 RepID=UPI00301C7BD5